MDGMASRSTDEASVEEITSGRDDTGLRHAHTLLQTALNNAEQGASCEEAITSEKSLEVISVLIQSSLDHYDTTVEMLLGALRDLSNDAAVHAATTANIQYFLNHSRELREAQRDMSIFQLSKQNIPAITVDETTSDVDNFQMTLGDKQASEVIIEPAPHKSDNETMRRKVVTEIYETEKAYAAVLNNIITFYVRPLRPFIEPKQAKVIWANVEEIAGLSHMILEECKKRVQGDAWKPTSTLGDLFLQVAPFFRMYIPYATSYEKGVRLLQEIIESNADAQVIVDSATAKLGIDVYSLLIQPVQRVPRYVLLLKELGKHTPDDHKDIAMLRDALSDIKEVAMEINESMRDFERDERVLELQKSLWGVGRVPTIVQPGRRLVYEGKLDKISRASGNLKRYTVFLFNDILLYASTSALLFGKYRFHNMMEFYGAARCSTAEGNMAVDADRCLEVTGSQGRLVFVAPTVEQANVWIDKIQECVNDNQSKRLSLRLSSS